MTHSVHQLCDQFADLVISKPSFDAEFASIDSPAKMQPESLVFVSELSQMFSSEEQQPAVVVTTEKIAAEISNRNICVVSVSNVRLAQALIKQHYSDYDASDSEWDTVHASAVIHPSATFGKNVRIGANTVIGKNVQIGDNTMIRANCVIEHDAKIGDNCIINNLVNIGMGCKLHNRIILRPGVVIGSEGFGFAQDEKRRYHRIPHSGIVELHDDVQVGVNSNIDRATYGKTVISRGVKIDAQCHVAHNCFVDEDALIIAQTGISGSCHIGKRVICSGQTGIIDHRTVADDAILVHRCGVTEDIPTAGMWAGTPPKPFKEYVRNLNLAKKVAKLEKKIEQLLAERETKT